MSDYPNGPYILHLYDWPDGMEVCEVFNGTVSFAGDARIYRLEKILAKGRLVRLVEVEQRQAGAGVDDAPIVK